MSEPSVFAGPRLRKEDFEQFREDLKLLLESYSPGVLAQWMGKDRGNFSRKLNGLEAITPKFLLNFRRTLNPVIDRLRKGDPPYQVEIDMQKGSVVMEESKDAVWEEISSLKARLDKLEAAMKEWRAEHLKVRGRGESADSIKEIKKI